MSGGLGWDGPARLCLTCGPAARTEPHPSQPGVTRCANCKEWLNRPATLVGPHSRACGWRLHEHGSACHAGCPTCGTDGPIGPTHADSEDIPPIFGQTVAVGVTELRQSHPEWLAYRVRNQDERVRLAIAQAGFDPAEFDGEIRVVVTYTPKPDTE